MDCPMNSTAVEKEIFTARLSLSPGFWDSAAPVSIDSKPEVLKKPKLEESVEVEVSKKEELDSKDTKLDEDEDEYDYDSDDSFVEVDDDDDDDDDNKAWSDDSDIIVEDEDGLHEMNEEEMDEYIERVNQSDGFDVPAFPKVIAYGIIVPVGNLFSNMAIYSEVEKCAEYALEQHNAEVKKNYTFHKIVKANVSGCAGVIYYITFQAKDLDKAAQGDENVGADGDKAGQGAENVGPAGGPIVEFEAKVFLRLPDEQRVCKMEVMNFRKKGAKVIEKDAKVIEGCCGPCRTSTE